MESRMKESHIEGLAIHGDSESGICAREGICEAMTGAHTGRVLSREKDTIRVPTLSTYAEGNMGMCKRASACLTLRGRRPFACMETPCARTGRSCNLPQKMEMGDAL